MSSWNERLNDAWKRTGWSKTELHRRSGVPYDNILKYLQGKVDQPRGDMLDKLADALEVDRLYLKEGIAEEQPDTRRVLVKGQVQAGYWAETWEWSGGSQYTVPVPDDPALRSFKLYGAEARGPSMNRRYPDGTIIVFTDAIETGEQLEIGKRYIVERERSDGMREGTVKTLWQDETGKLWLRPESDDPRFQALIPIEGEEGDTIRIVGRVRYAVTKE